MKRFVSILPLLFSFSVLFSQETGYIVDKRDSQVYKVVKIGEQWWMAENMRAIKYSDGTPLQKIEGNSTWSAQAPTDKAYCYYNNDSVSHSSVYGCLYTWAAALNGSTHSNANPSGIQGICPPGWHMPSEAEWDELLNYLGEGAGGKLKETGYEHWNSPNGGATNESGFTAVGGGFRDNTGKFGSKGLYGYIWSTSQHDWTYGISRRLNSVYDWTERVYFWHKKCGMSVRCVKDSSFFYHLTGDTICYGEESSITSFFDNTDWYSDPGLTNLVYTGDTLDLYDLKVGIYTYYAIIHVNETTEVIDSARVTVHANPVINNVESTNESACNTNDGHITIDATDNNPLVFSINGGKSYPDSTGIFEGLGNGNYPVVVKNSYGCKTAGSTIEIISEEDIPPAPVTSGDAVYCEGDPLGGINATASQGGTITWYSDPGLTTVIGTGEYLVPPDLSGTHSYYVTETLDNCESPSNTVRVRVIAYELPKPVDICLVTIDLATGKNLIVWEQSSELGIVSYNIYRETEKIDEYELIGIVDRDDLSIFLDQDSDPEARQYVYKITAVDYCGNESLYSSYHKPMFLQFNGYAGGVNLIWSDYEIEGGEVSFVTYDIYRGGESGSLEKIDQVSSRLDRYTDNDPEALKQKYYYRIAGVLDYPCYPSAGNTKTEESYGYSMSNMEDNQITVSTGSLSGPDVTIYPNPFSETTSIRFNNPEGRPFTLSLTDISGKVCREYNHITTSEINLERGDLNSGIYFIELRGSETYRSTLVVE